MTLTAAKQGVQLSELDPWGSVADLGSDILEGDVNAFGKMTHGAPTDPVSSAYFGTTRGKLHGLPVRRAGGDRHRRNPADR